MSTSSLDRILDLSLSGAAFRLSAIALALCSVVIPNALQITNGALLVVTAGLGLFFVRLPRSAILPFLLYLASALVTVVYMLVGSQNGAPRIALEQTTIVYILSPLLWIVVCLGLVQSFEQRVIVGWLAALGILCCVTVALYFFLFLNFGAASVSFFKEAGNNVNVDDDGTTGATMHVYGSLIFLSGAFFSSPEIVRSKVVRILLLGSLFVAAITSGRSALVVSVLLGLFLGWIPELRIAERRAFFGARLMTNFVFVLVATAFGVWVSKRFIDFDVWRIFEFVFEEVLSGGGQARTGQLEALLDGVEKTSGLGAGHGIGVHYIRNFATPWRYELVWAATLYRVGIIGSFVYALPFLVYLARGFQRAFQGRLPVHEKFMLSGFVCAFFASNTNPYIEAFGFQWMYVLPVISFFADSPSEQESALDSDFERDSGDSTNSEPPRAPALGSG